MMVGFCSVIITRLSVYYVFIKAVMLLALATNTHEIKHDVHNNFVACEQRVCDKRQKSESQKAKQHVRREEWYSMRENVCVVYVIDQNHLTSRVSTHCTVDSAAHTNFRLLHCVSHVRNWDVQRLFRPQIPHLTVKCSICSTLSRLKENA